MFCKYCGKEISDDATFCQYCGGSLVDKTTVISPQHMTVEVVEQRNAPIEDKIRNILKIVIMKLLQLVGIVAVSFASAFIVYHVFMFINKPCSSKEEAYRRDLESGVHFNYEGGMTTISPSSSYGHYKYDKEVTDYEHMEMNRWQICETHAGNWSVLTFIIVGAGLLLFFFIRWLYKPKLIEKNVAKEG